MKISANWLRELFPHEVDVQQAVQVLTATGLEVEGVDHFEAVPGGLRGVIVGHVTGVVQHPNADRLRICTVDVGLEDGPLNIVCGASNVAEGQKVPVATVGTTLHPQGGEPFKIKKGKIRGEVSLGMICAEDELGLGSGHDGIMVLAQDAPVGADLAQVVGLEGDDVIEIGLTPNRNDAMGHWGVARDLRAGLLHGTVEGIGPMSADDLVLHECSDLNAALKETASVSLSVDATEDCPHYLAVELHNVKVGPSPDWAQKRLRAIGVQPLNNVVDATNLVLHEFGNPLHAFDMDKIGGGQIVVRKAAQGEPFTTLDGEGRELDANDLVIADAAKAMCLAGVYGGLDSGVSESTTKVILEAAWFNPVTVRKSAKRHTLSTDASFRFERGVDPNTVRLAAERCTQLLTEWSGAQVAAATEHMDTATVQDAQVKLDLGWLTRFLGTDISQDRLKSILASLDIAVSEELASTWMLTVPAYRSDVTRPADVAEEILRIHGFDHVPLPTRMTGTLEVPAKPNREDVLFGWRELLVSQGFTEIMSNSLTKAKYAELVKDRDLHPEASVHMLNPLSSDLGAMRQSLVFQGLEAVARNSKHKQPDLRMFEFGRTYTQRDVTEEDGTVRKTYDEKEHLSLWVTGRDKPETWNAPKGKDGQANMFTLKHAVESLLAKVGLNVLSEAEADTDGLLAEGIVLRHANGQEVGRWGLMQPSVAQACDVDVPVFWADFDVAKLWKVVKKRRVKAHDLARFPSVRRDFAVVVAKSVAYETLKLAAEKAERKWLRGVELFDVYEGKGLQEGEQSYALAFTLQNPDATLNDKQIDSAMSRILKALESAGARLR
jgi:phenylalanyl-tRNA synthetase beta chain